MSKNIFIFLMLNFFVAGNLFAQKEDRNWVFGDSIGIDFNDLANPTVFSAACSNYEANASYSTRNGELDFYYSHIPIQNNISYGKILNNQNLVIENGDSIKLNFSMTNGGIFIPDPNDTNKLFLFAIDYDINSEVRNLDYNVIDKSYNSGFGKVISKNNFLIDSITEHLIVVKHGNGRDWWVITKKLYTNTIIKFLLTPDGIFGPFEQSIGSTSFSYLGEGAVTQLGDKIAFVSDWGNADVFNFDRCTGSLSNWLELGETPYDTFQYIIDMSYYGCEFSPDGQRIYLNKFNEPLHKSEIVQFTLNASNPYNTLYPVLDTTNNIIIGQIQLGPDGKIYIANQWYPFQDSSSKYLSVINNPNDSAVACNLTMYSFYLQGKKSTIGLPNMPNYNLGKLIGSECDTLTSIQNENLKTKNSVSIYPNPARNELAVSSSQLAINTIEITDALGRKIYSEQINLKSKIINLKSFPSGVYLIKLQMQNGEMQVMKFVRAASGGKE